MSAPTRPRTAQVPRVGRRMRVSSFSDRGLARAVGSDDAERLARLHLERHVAQAQKSSRSASGRVAAAAQRAPHRRNQVAQAVVTLAAAELLPDAVEADDGPRPSDALGELEFGPVER